VAIAGGSAGGGLVFVILVVVLLMFIYKKGCFAKKTKSIEVKPQATVTEAAPSNEPLSPVDGRKRAHSRLDQMSVLAKAVAARVMAPGQRDIELARLAAHQKSGTPAPPPVCTATSVTPNQVALSVDESSTTHALTPEQINLLRSRLDSAKPPTGAAAVNVEAGQPEESTEPQTPVSPLKRAGSAFVEKIGWMSTKSAKRIGKTPMKGEQAEAMARVAAISAMGTISVKDDGRASCSNKFTSTPL